MRIVSIIGFLLCLSATSAIADPLPKNNFVVYSVRGDCNQEDCMSAVRASLRPLQPFITSLNVVELAQRQTLDYKVVTISFTKLDDAPFDRVADKLTGLGYTVISYVIHDTHTGADTIIRIDVMAYTLPELADYLKKTQPSFIEEAAIVCGELIVTTGIAHIVPFTAFLRDDAECQFKQLVDICGVDYPQRAKRFDVVYNLLSVKLNRRIRIKVLTDEVTPVPSVTGLFASAGWYEREAWDMYGVYFSGNADLRRILTDYGFDGHPQRKDFPLTGYVELRYDPERQRVAYGPVKLPQAYRTFDFMSPWEGSEYILPGDEKAAGNG